MELDKCGKSQENRTQMLENEADRFLGQMSTAGEVRTLSLNSKNLETFSLYTSLNDSCSLMNVDGAGTKKKSPKRLQLKLDFDQK